MLLLLSVGNQSTFCTTKRSHNRHEDSSCSTQIEDGVLFVLLDYGYNFGMFAFLNKYMSNVVALSLSQAFSASRVFLFWCSFIFFVPRDWNFA